jgi:hypothetical protein
MGAELAFMIRHRLEAYATLARRVVGVGSRTSRQVILKHRSIINKG